jgi:uncharacterized integral membrane protein
MILFLILGLVIGAAAVVFALQNMTPITVVFLTWKIEGSLAVILILSFAVGMLVSFLFILPEFMRRSFQLSSLRRKNNKLGEKSQNQAIEIEQEKAKVVANNAYLDDLEKKSNI